MLGDPQPTAFCIRGQDTPEERIDIANMLRSYGCRYVRYENRSDGTFAGLGFLTQGINTELL